MDKRHQRRILLMQALYAQSFHAQPWEIQDFGFDDKIIAKISDIQPFLPEFDQKIQAVAPERPINEISKIDLTILRMIIYERQSKNTPIKVLIDEGVELAKEFGNDNSFAFINAVLEKILITPEEKAALREEEKKQKEPEET